MNNQHLHQSSDYHTLNDIRLRKAQLRTDITKDGNRIAGLWDELVHKPKDTNTPTQKKIQFVQKEEELTSKRAVR